MAKIEYLRKKGSKIVLAATKRLMKRADLFPCDEDGNIVTSMTHHSLNSVNIDLAAKRLSAAMKISIEEARLIIAGKHSAQTNKDETGMRDPVKDAEKTKEGVEIGPDDEGEEPEGEEEKRPAPSQWTKEDYFKFAIKDFGEAAVVARELSVKTMNKEQMKAIYDDMAAQKDLQAAMKK